MIYERGKASDQEETLTQTAFKALPDSKYRSLVPAESAKTYAYIVALRTSYARYQGALGSGDKDWAAKQLKAAQEYAKLAADSLVAESQQDDQDGAHLQGTPFAVRRSSTEQAAFFERLKTAGLPSECRKLMLESGRTEAEIAAFQQQLLKFPRDKAGISPVEMLLQIAASRRELAAELNTFAQADPGAITGTSTQTFMVGNPHDKQETVELFIRPISIPPDWKLSVTDGEEQPKFKVREVEAGEHYAVTLPAKTQVKVASVVVPVGEVGANTTARWAVEGKIGDELIGGMVHEMNVPYIIADLQLPPVGSKETEEESPTPSKDWARIATEVAATILLGVVMYLFLFWRRRHSAKGAT